MTELIHVCTSWPTLVVTTLLGLVVLYWLCVILGALDFDLFDFDVDLDGQPDSFLDWGMVGLKWFNLGEVPLMVWLTSEWCTPSSRASSEGRMPFLTIQDLICTELRVIMTLP